MKKNIQRLIGLWAVATLLALPSANAGLRFSVFGAGTFSSIKNTAAVATTTSSAKLGIGGGAQLELMLGQVVGLELGGLYLQRKFSTTDSLLAITAESTFTYVQIPLQVRFWLGRFVTLGVGGYYAMGLGDIKSTALGIPITTTYAAAGTKTSDYGLLGSLGFNIPLGTSVAILAEGRYAYGMQDLNVTKDPAGTAKWRDMQALIGLRFGMMGK
jgi:hypothetical protein